MPLLAPRSETLSGRKEKVSAYALFASVLRFTPCFNAPIPRLWRQVFALPRLVAFAWLCASAQVPAQALYPTVRTGTVPYPNAQIVGHLASLKNTDFLPNLHKTYVDYYAPTLPTAVNFLTDESWSTGVQDMWVTPNDTTEYLLDGTFAGGPFFAGKHSIIVIGNTIKSGAGYDFVELVRARLVFEDGTTTDWKSLRTRMYNPNALLSNSQWYGYGGINSTIDWPTDGAQTWFSVNPLDDWLMHSLTNVDGRGVVGIQMTRFNSDTPGTGVQISFIGVIAHPRAASICIRDSNRFGNASSGLAGATVKFIAGSNGVVGTAVTDSNGFIDMTTLPAVTLSDLYDIQVEKGTWMRVYQAVRPQDVVNGTVQIVMPVTLQEKLVTELDKLKATGTLSLDYDITRAKQLTTLRNRLLPESIDDHHTHDLGLARLLVATESMSRIYTAVEPLAKDAGKVLADSIISILALREAADDVEAGAATSLLTASATQRAKAYVMGMLSVSLKHALTAQLKILVDGSRQLLPAWAADLVSQSSSDISTGILNAFVTSAWSKPDGRKQLLESMAALLSEQVGGRIIASAHVDQTQMDFDLAEVRARQDSGDGELSAAFKAALDKAIDVETSIDTAMTESELIGDTTSKFGQVADYADLAGKIPAAQIASLMARLIKAINVGLTARVLTTEMSTLYDVAFTGTPAAADLAFFPTGHGSPAPNGTLQVQGTLQFPQQAYLKSSATAAYAAFGKSIAISGDTVAVGVPSEGNSGAVYIYVRNGGVWSQQACLKSSNLQAYDTFGGSVAISGDTVVVGAVGEDSAATGVNGDPNDNSRSSAGAAYVFVRNGTTWSQQAYLKASNTGSSDSFGGSVSVSGDTVVVGAWAEDSNATGINGDQSNNLSGNSGAAYVFVRDAGVWSQQAYLKASNTGSGNSFGGCVSVSGSSLAIGATGQGDNTGAVYVFERDGSTWNQQAYLKSTNAQSGDAFAESLSISGNVLVVGSRLEDSSATGINATPDENASDSGAAYVFERNGSTWNQQAFLKASNAAESNGFGYCVSSESGDRVVVGAPWAVNNVGAAYVFVRNRSGWSQQTFVNASNSAWNDRFGYAVAVSGDTAVVGAYQEDSNAMGVGGDQTNNSATDSGAAYVFTGIGPVLGTNSNLASLALGGGTLSPQFVATSTAYSAGVGSSVSSITVTPTAADINATITVNGVPVNSGSASNAIPLKSGTNTIFVAVTAENGVTTKTYTVTMTRAVVSNSVLAYLDDLQYAVLTADSSAALDAAESLLAADQNFATRMNTVDLQARARAAKSNPADPALATALVQLRNNALALHSALAEMYPATIGYIVPEMGDPEMTNAKFKGLCDTVVSAMNAYETAEASVQQAGVGIVAPPLLVFSSHGLAGQASSTTPGEITLRASITNAGDTAANNVSAELIVEPAASAVQPFALSSTARCEIGTLEPGQSKELSWRGVASDSSTEGIGSVANYYLVTETDGVTAGSEWGKFRVLSQHPGYDQWAASLGGLGSHSGFDDDADGDGVSNGLENLFGTDPRVPSAPAFHIRSDGRSTYLEHSRSAVFGSDISHGYEWSPDLISWFPNGAVHNGVSVLFNPIVSSGVSTETKTIQVIPEVSGSANRLFYRMRAERAAPSSQALAPTPPQISTQPMSLTLSAGQAAEFSVQTTGTGPFLYQWRKNGTDIPEAIDPVMRIAAVSNSDSGSYSVRILAPGGSIVSDEVSLSVGP